MLKGSSILVALYLLMALATGNVNAQQNRRESIHGASTPNRMPLVFTKNMGQWDDRVLFRTDAGGATMWFMKDGVTYQFTRRAGPGSAVASLNTNSSGHWASAAMAHEPDSIDQLVFSARFVGANPNVEVISEGLMEYKCNYFLGSDPAGWRTDVPNFELITYKDIYPGIDLRYSSDGFGQAVCEIVAGPDAELSQLNVEYEAIEGIFIDSERKLKMKTKWGEIVEAFESGPGLVSLSGLASPTGTVVSSPHKKLQQGVMSETLVMTYGSYLGGAGDDYGYGIAIDSSGNVYVTGNTNTADFPTVFPHSTYHSGWDVFVAKLSNEDNSLVFSTYFGGASHDFAWDLAADKSGDIYVTGYTYSADLPIVNPYQSYQGVADAYVTKLSSLGNSISYSTYLGGTGFEMAFSIAVDEGGSAYVTGETGSPTFPTLNSLQSLRDGDAFVTRLSSSGSSLIYSTFLGGG